MILLFLVFFSSLAVASPCPLPLEPPIKKEMPFVKPAGAYKQPQHFDTKEEAQSHKGLIQKDYITEKGWFVLYPRKSD
jgi:hypothetical protein